MARETSPCTVLGTAVDVSPMVQQHLDDLSPAPRTGFMEGCVTCIVTAIDLPDVLLKTVENYILRAKV